MTAQENSKESLVKVTLLELIRGFLEYATDKGVKTFPPLKNRLWRELLYRLKENPGHLASILPQILGEFDFQGRHISKELIRRLMRFCLQRCYDLRLRLNPRAPRLKDGYSFFEPPWFKDAVVRTFELASETPWFFEK